MVVNEMDGLRSVSVKLWLAFDGHSPDKKFGGGLVGFHQFVCTEPLQRGDCLIDSALIQPGITVVKVNAANRLSQPAQEQHLAESLPLSSVRAFDVAFDVLPAHPLELFN